jgi:polysaccharide biosynthesis/export protein
MMRRGALLLGTVFCLLIIVVAVLAAQERQETVPAPPAVAPEEEALKKSVGAPIDPNTYLIGAEDILQIRVWREADLSGPVAVRPDGKVSMPLIGDLQAAGNTPLKLAAMIKEGLLKYVTEPEVMVSVMSVNSKKYFVMGGVNRPGQYPLVVPTTISQALTIAGGFREYADTKNVLIMRGPKRYKFNYRDWSRGKNLSQDIYLQSGDHIVVAE